MKNYTGLELQLTTKFAIIFMCIHVSILPTSKLLKQFNCDKHIALYVT